MEGSLPPPFQDAAGTDRPAVDAVRTKELQTIDVRCAGRCCCGRKQAEPVRERLPRPSPKCHWSSSSAPSAKPIGPQIRGREGNPSTQPDPRPNQDVGSILLRNQPDGRTDGWADVPTSVRDSRWVRDCRSACACP
jgi:hypothetical protein